MKLSVAMAALFLAATAALPAAARTPTGHSFYQHEGRSLNLRTGLSPYRTGVDAYATAPGMVRQRAANRGHCVSGVPGESSSAYPSWDMCPN